VRDTCKGAQSLRTPGMPSDRPTQIYPTLRWPESRKGPTAAEAHGFTLPREPSLWLPPEIWVLLRWEGWHVNKKRVHRLWREQGLKVTLKQRKRRQLSGDGENGCARQRAEYVNRVWSYDFVMDQTPMRWPSAEDIAGRGGVHQGVPVHRCRADHHRRGCRIKTPEQPSCSSCEENPPSSPLGQRPRVHRQGC
jgi:hypothetical protein